MSMGTFEICEECSTSGVYIIVNVNNKKVYIGSSSDIRKRLVGHKSRLMCGKHPNKKMQDDYLNGCNFISYVLTPVRMRPEKYFENDDLLYFETQAINIFNSCNPENGYNLREGFGKSTELEKIKRAKHDLDFFFSSNDPKYPMCDISRKTVREDFINKYIKKCV